MAKTAFILDTDTGTDVDDALAIAFAVRHPELDLRAVTTVSGDTVRRARIAKKLLMLAGRDDIEVAAGIRGDEHPQRRSEAGHEDDMLGPWTDELVLSERDGVTLLLEECAAHRYEVCTVGMQSNVAAALERDPSFSDDVPRLTVMGGIFAPPRFLDQVLTPAVDHNLNVDQQASLRALSAGIPTLYVPGDITFQAWLKAPHLERLRTGDALCRELARQIDIWVVRLQSRGRGIIPAEYVCLLHDPLAVACMTPAGRRFVRTERMPVTVALHQSIVRTFVDPAAGAEAEVVTGLDAESFAEFWLETVLR
ncbi:MAG: nucleoside hydrolase [Chloroflexi bacterium]|nr:nucleoside hydrolase [Chloroflexota bacterium]